MNSQNKTRECRAFTLVDLMVVVAVLAVVTLVALPALAGARSDTKTTQCLNNLRRLTGAWLMYSNDNFELFPLKLVSTGMDWTANPDNTNTLKLIDPGQSMIARYVQSPDLFKCPADNYQSPLNPGPRVLSISGNAILGNGIQPANVLNEIPGRTYISKFTKLTQLNKPGPANTIALLDEHADSINDALFIFSVGRLTSGAYFASLPGNRHANGAVISFADGHAIVKQWLDPRTFPTVGYFPKGNLPIPGSPDYAWINDRMPYR